MIDTADIFHHIVYGDSTLVEHKFFGHITNGLWHVFEGGCCLGADKRNGVFIRLLATPHHIDCGESVRAFLQHEINTLVTLICQFKGALLSSITDRVHLESSFSCREPTEREITVGFGANGVFRAFYHDDSFADGVAVVVGDLSTDLS